MSRAVKITPNHLWREGLGHPHIPFSNTEGVIWGSELEGVGDGGGKEDTCKPDVSSIAPQNQVQLGEGWNLANLGCSCNFHNQMAGSLPSLRAEACEFSSSS